MSRVNTFSTTSLFPTADAPSGESQASTNGKPKQGQQTRTITPLMPGWNWGGKMGNYSSQWPWLPNGPLPSPQSCNANNPWGWAGPGTPWLGTWDVYEWMLKHYKVAHVLQEIINPVLEAPWEAVIEGDEDDQGPKVPQNILDATEKVFNRLRRKYVEDGARSLPYGTVAFEVVWRQDDFLKLIVPDKFVPQSVYSTQILRDNAGNFAGIRPGLWVQTPQQAKGATQPYLGVLYSFIVKYNAPFGSLYGQSILENIRETAWRGWLQAFSQVGKLGEKVAGTIGMMLYPAGTYTDENGSRFNFEDSANKAVQGLMKNQFVTMQNLSLSGATPQEIAELATKSLVDLKVVDLGDQAKSVTGFVELLVHWEHAICEGLLTSPQITGDVEHGSKSSSEFHGVRADRFSEKVNSDLPQALNDLYGPVSNFVALNFGEQYRGQVKLQATPVNDERIGACRSFVAAAVNQPQIAGTFVKMVDRVRLLDNIGLPVTGQDADPKDLEALVQVTPPPDKKLPAGKVDKEPIGKGPDSNV